MRVLLVVALVGCAHPKGLPADGPGERPRDQTRHYTIWLGGARVGTATEIETWSNAGVHLRRSEHMKFLRGDASVELDTAIEIDASTGLVPQRVHWREHGSEMHEADAVKSPAGWRVSTGEQLTSDAVPAELVPLIVRRDGSFTGRVFLPARRFVGGSGRIEPVAPGRLVARLVLDRGPVVEATIDLDSDRSPARIVDGEGVIALRATAEQASEPFPAVDLIAATAIPITGVQSHRVLLDGNVALPPLPGQHAQLSALGVEVELGKSLAGGMPAGATQRDRSREIRSLVAAVRARITPDLSARPRESSTATAGDCTTFALAYAALASTRRIPTRVITGFRVDDARLVRHRWAISWTGTKWIAIDAAFGEVPAGGNLIGLAVHDADDAGLIAGEAALTQIHAAAWTP